MTKTVTNRISLYNGDVVIDFYPNSHRYKLVELDGEPQSEWIPSPSSINNKLDKSQALIPWAIGCFYDKMKELMEEGVQFSRSELEAMLEVAKVAHTDKKEAAASVGSIVHHFAEHGEISEDINDLDEEQQKLVHSAIDSFKAWRDEHLPEMLQSEFLVFSRKHKFVGTADGLAVIDGKKYLIDYKTSKGIYTSHLYQVAAYLKAWEEEHGEKLEGAMIIHFRKDDVYDKDDNILFEAGSFGVKTLSRGDLVKAYKGFKGLLNVYHTDKEIWGMLK